MPKVLFSIEIDSDNEDHLITLAKMEELLKKRHGNLYFNLDNLMDYFHGKTIYSLESKDENTIDLNKFAKIVEVIDMKLNHIVKFTSEEELAKFLEDILANEEVQKIIKRS